MTPFFPPTCLIPRFIFSLFWLSSKLRIMRTKMRVYVWNYAKQTSRRWWLLDPPKVPLALFHYKCNFLRPIMLMKMKSEIVYACMEISFLITICFGRKWPKYIYVLHLSRKGSFNPFLFFFFSANPQLHAWLHNYVAKLVGWPAKKKSQLKLSKQRRNP